MTNPEPAAERPAPRPGAGTAQEAGLQEADRRHAVEAKAEDEVHEHAAEFLAPGYFCERCFTAGKFAAAPQGQQDALAQTLLNVPLHLLYRNFSYRADGRVRCELFDHIGGEEGAYYEGEGATALEALQAALKAAQHG